MDKIKDNNQNKVKARGRVIAIGRDDYGHRSMLVLIRNGYSSKPNIISFALGTELPLNIAVRSYVDIDGHITAYSYHNEVWNRRGYVQYFVADQVRLAKTQIELAFPEEGENQGFSFGNSYIEASLKGEIVKVTKSENQKGPETGKPRVWTNVILRVDPVDKEPRPSVISVQYSSNMRVSDVQLAVGDKICLVATVSSSRKVSDPNPEIGKAGTYGRRTVKNFEDIVVNDIAIIESAHPETETEDIMNILQEDELIEDTAPASALASKQNEHESEEDDEENFFDGVKSE